MVQYNQDIENQFESFLDMKLTKQILPITKQHGQKIELNQLCLSN